MTLRPYLFKTKDSSVERTREHDEKCEYLARLVGGESNVVIRDSRPRFYKWRGRTILQRGFKAIEFDVLVDDRIVLEYKPWIGSKHEQMEECGIEKWFLVGITSDGRIVLFSPKIVKPSSLRSEILRN